MIHKKVSGAGYQGVGLQVVGFFSSFKCPQTPGTLSTLPLWTIMSRERPPARSENVLLFETTTSITAGPHMPKPQPAHLEIVGMLRAKTGHRRPGERTSQATEMPTGIGAIVEHLFH